GDAAPAAHPATRPAASTAATHAAGSRRRSFPAASGRGPRTSAVLHEVNVKPRISCVKLTAHPYERICCPRGSTRVVHQRTENHLNVTSQAPGARRRQGRMARPGRVAWLPAQLTGGGGAPCTR